MTKKILTMAVPLHRPTPVEVLPLHTTTNNDTTNIINNNNQHRRVIHSAASLRGSSTLCNNDISCNDGGDVIAFLKEDAKRKVVVQRMDGTDVASFDLPVDNDGGSGNNNGSNRRMHRNGTYEHVKNNEESEWSEGYPTQVLCWASFHKQNDSNNDNERLSSGSGGGGRKMLCVLGNQTTLLVFDVLGDTAILATSGNHNKTNNLDDDDDAGGGPAGHTISLPFRAQSIYPVPNGCGLIVVRTPAEEDYLAVQDLEDGEEEVQSSLAFGGGGRAEGDESIPPPPSALGMSLPATPRRELYEPGKSTEEDDDELSLEIGPPDPLRFGVSSNNNFNGGAGVVA